MMNAKQEFLEQVNNRGLICAELQLGEYELDNSSSFLLKLNHTKAELQTFLESINFNYDDGYGGQNLFGFIWHTGASWSERFEYDGAENWDFKEIPTIPQYLTQIML